MNTINLGLGNEARFDRRAGNARGRGRSAGLRAWWLLSALALVAAPSRAEVKLIFNRPTVSAPLEHDSDTLWTVTMAELGNAEGLVLVDRKSLHDALAEMALGEQQLASAEGASRVGKILGANYLVNAKCAKAKDLVLVTVQVVDIATSRTQSGYETVTAEDTPALGRAIAVLARKTLDRIRPADGAEAVAAPLRPVLPADAPRPRVAVFIPEQHVNQEVRDPAAETELVRRLLEEKFPVVDLAIRAAMAREAGNPLETAVRLGREKDLDYIIYGEAISERSDRVGSFTGGRARVEVKVVHVRTGAIVLSESAYGGATDLAETVAGKKALQNAADKLADLLLPKLLTAHGESN